MQTDQTMRHLMGDFAREVARDSGQFRERAGGNPSEKDVPTARGTSTARRFYDGE